jgi:DNA-binding NarL/FixJ family response regulator
LKLDPRGPPRERSLSAREREIALLAVHGRAYKLIAAELGVSISTVAGRVDRVLAKLGVASRAELICVLGPLASVRPAGRRASRGFP